MYILSNLCVRHVGVTYSAAVADLLVESVCDVTEVTDESEDEEEDDDDDDDFLALLDAVGLSLNFELLGRGDFALSFSLGGCSGSEYIMYSASSCLLLDLSLKKINKICVLSEGTERGTSYLWHQPSVNKFLTPNRFEIYWELSALCEWAHNNKTLIYICKFN